MSYLLHMPDDGGRKIPKPSNRPKLYPPPDDPEQVMPITVATQEIVTESENEALVICWKNFVPSSLIQVNISLRSYGGSSMHVKCVDLGITFAYNKNFSVSTLNAEDTMSHV